jgi:DNA mismatch repair protein MutL
VNERLVFVSVQKAVRRTLIETAAVPRMEEVTTAYNAPRVSRQLTWTQPESRSNAAATPQAAAYTPAVSLPVLRVLGQLSSSYIVAEGPEGLYLIDQHAAHERILFDRVNDRTSQEMEIQGLLEPVTLEVSPRQEEVLKSRYEDLAQFGFSIEPFGNRTYLVRAVPAVLYRKDWMGTVRELLDSLVGDNKENWRENLAMSLACHGAVRAGQVLTIDEMRELIRQLEQTAVPQTCPHGRPTMIRISSGQLEKEFGRT